MAISFRKVEHNYKGLKKNDFVAALHNINLDIAKDDEFVAVVGQTGSGKSTLVSHMNALLLPTSGEVKIFDYVITPKKRKNPKLKPIRKRIGFVFQFPEYQLFEETVLKDIMFGPKNFGIKEEEAKTKALQAAKLLDISDELLTKSPFNLSGGQMRKVAIAGILAYNPDILLLDEPTRGLDPKTASEVMAIFNKINKEYHKTIIVITHDMNLVYKYANRVIGMKDGQIHFDGKPLDLFSSDIYKECHLAKPDILALVDYLNLKMDLNLGYDIYSEEELLKRLKDVTK